LYGRGYAATSMAFGFDRISFVRVYLAGCPILVLQRLQPWPRHPPIEKKMVIGDKDEIDLLPQMR